MNDLPIEETNLAGIGSDQDKALKAAAAKMDFHWEGAGQIPGVQVWRVENKRTESDTADFGINVWPKEKYGQFHRGDSYIVLWTSKEEVAGGEGEALQWDIFFWIGSESSQDEYGVAAYKANELDDLLGGSPMQHREIEGCESEEFFDCFPKGVTYLEGGINSGFRRVDETDTDRVIRLFRFHKKPGPNHPPRCFEVPLKCSSLNDGDAFLLDAGAKIFTWFGSSVSAFEKNKSASVAHNLHGNRLGHCECLLDVEDDNEEFWGYLGGRGEIGPAVEEEEPAEDGGSKMFAVSDETGKVTVKQVELSREALLSDRVIMVDSGKSGFVWVGKDASTSVQHQAMTIMIRYLNAMGRDKSTCITRVNEGSERRCRTFLKAF